MLASLWWAAVAWAAPATPSPAVVSFGQVAVGQTSNTQTVTFTFQESDYVNEAVVYTEGLVGREFLPTRGGSCSNYTVYNAGQSCTVTVTFTPSSVGVVRGAVVLLGNSQDSGGSNIPVGTAYLAGSGKGGMLVMSSGVVQTLTTISAAQAPTHATTDRRGNVYTVQATDAGAQVMVHAPDGSSYGSKTIPLSAGTAAGCCGIAIDGIGDYFSGAWKVPAFGPAVNIAPDVARAVDVATDAKGNAFILETSGASGQPAGLIEVAADGTEHRVATLPAGAMYEAMDAAGNVYVSCASQFVKVTPAGAVVPLFGTTKATPFAIDANGVFYFSQAFLSGVKPTVAFVSVDGPVLAVDARGALLYTAPGTGRNVNLVRRDRSMAALNFAKTQVGASSAPITVNFKNGGNDLLVPLNDGGEIVGTNAADFRVGEDTCTNAGLKPGQACAASFIFQPTASGTRSATASVQSTAPDSPQAIALKGSGVGPAATLSRTTVQFSSVYCATRPTETESVTLTNTGNAALKLTQNVALTGANAQYFFLQPGGTCIAGTSLAPGQSCSASAYLVAPDGTPQRAMLNFYDDAAGSPQQALLTGTQDATPYLNPSSMSLFMQASAIHQAGTPINFAFSNEECGKGTFSGFSITGPNAADFAILSNGCAGAVLVGSHNDGPTGRCSIQFVYTPSGTAPEFATLTVTDNAPSSPTTFPITGVYTGTTQAAKK